MESLMKDYGWVVLGLAAALSAAGVTIFGSIGLDKVEPILATTLRSIIMMVTLVAVSFTSGQLQTGLALYYSGRFFRRYLLAGLLCRLAARGRQQDFGPGPAECGLYLCSQHPLFGRTAQLAGLAGPGTFGFRGLFDCL
jgi:hypothetical protein